MHRFRALLLRHRAIAFGLIAAALCLKVLVPTGYMLDRGGQSIVVRICDDGLSHTVARAITIHASADKTSDHDTPAGKQAAPACPFSVLSFAALGSADPVLLALALGFILALGLAAAPAPSLRRTAYLRPPLRAPPALV